jgi:hypothetical protein
MGDSKAIVHNPSETAVVLDGITRAALDPSIDVAKLERLLAIQERLLADQRKTAFMAALARLQAVLPQITKQGTILDNSGRARNRFAKIEDIDAQIRPLLAEEGFSFAFDSKQTGSVIEFTGTLHHREGHAVEKTLSLPIDNGAGRNAVQSVGSTTSYARRYLLSMHLNLVTRDEDDDGMGGASKGPITEAQTAELRKLLEDVGGDPKRFFKWAGVERLEDLPLGKYGPALKFIEEKKRQKAGGGGK